jgi:hypothetical protein
LPYGIAVDANNNVYVADTGNHTIRKITPSGTNWITTTIAGLAGNLGSADGMNSAAQFNTPYGVAVDANNNVYVADTGNNAIRKITLAGTNWITTTIGGLAGSSGSADGMNSDARFDGPYGVAADANNNVYVADTYNFTIRKGVPLTNSPVAAPTIITQPMNQTVTVGGTATFNVTAGGTSPLSYLWYFNAIPLVGANNASLTLTNVQLTDAGGYFVVVRNAYGSVTSSNAVLTVSTLLGVSLNYPKISYNNANTSALSYSASNQLFSISATPTAALFANGEPPRMISGTKNLQIQILVNNTGALVGGVAGDDLTLTGTVTEGANTYTGVLLTGEVTGFGFLESGGTDVYDLRFRPTGGALAGLFPGDIAVQVTSGFSTFNNDFTVNFNGRATGTLGSENITTSNKSGNMAQQQAAMLLSVGCQPAFATANSGDKSIGLIFNGIPGYTYRLEYTEDLSHPAWKTLTTQTADDFGVCQFIDSSLTNNIPARFYRIQPGN